LGATGAAGAVADEQHWGRDLAIGAGAGLLLGLVIGGIDANYSGPRVSVHADVDQMPTGGTPALSGAVTTFARRF
jgi:hypothetical protein